MIWLRADTPSETPYRITLSYRDPFETPADREPNDFPPQAVPLPPTLAVAGEVGQFGDEDWFNLPALERAGSVRIRPTGR